MWKEGYVTKCTEINERYYIFIHVNFIHRISFLLKESRYKLRTSFFVLQPTVWNIPKTVNKFLKIILDNDNRNSVYFIMSAQRVKLCDSDVYFHHEHTST
jgi:hypothetical protein